MVAKCVCHLAQNMRSFNFKPLGWTTRWHGHYRKAVHVYQVCLSVPLATEISCGIKSKSARFVFQSWTSKPYFTLNNCERAIKPNLVSQYYTLWENSHQWLVINIPMSWKRNYIHQALLFIIWPNCHHIMFEENLQEKFT